jgi:hypothetical protein
MNTKKPDWFRRLIKNAKQRERYFIKRYGNLNRMYIIDEKFQSWLDDDNFEDEMNYFKDETQNKDEGL